MKAVFVGGGSFRTLPIVRAAMAGKNAFKNGELWLVDFNLARVETVGRLIMRTPEFAGSGCKVKWTDKLDQALPGADLVSVSFPVGSSKVCMQSEVASRKYGFHGSDQLSVSGAFRSLTGGTIILDIARRMEKYCPDAWLVDHANPVAVYSGMVNNHTRIKALGLCGSCYHPRWDLTRLLFEEDQYRDVFKFASAGVNHLTFLLRCEYKGRDVYKMLDEKYQDQPWAPRLAKTTGSTLKTLHFSYHIWRRMRQQFGMITCSNELEGPIHLYPDEFPIAQGEKPMPAAAIKAAERKGREAREKADLEFRAHLDRKLDAAFWAQTDLENRHFGAAPSDATAVVLKALGTNQPQWLAASLPNRGAVPGFKDRTVLEYSFTLSKKGIRPDPDLEVPDCFHGLISSLACHQTLLGDAIATRDPKLFADALYAYPFQQGTDKAVALWRELLKIHAAEIPAEFQKTKAYFT